MKKVYAIVLVLAIGVAACSDSDKKGYDSSLAPANATKPVTPVTIADTLLSDTSTNNASLSSTGSRTSVVSQTVKPVINTQPAKGGAGLNPAHGLPGHRCEIAVGAPLSSAPAAATPSLPAQVTPVTQPTITQKSPVSGSSARLNPAHGEPGHDCAVQVGAPLKN